MSSPTNQLPDLQKLNHRLALNTVRVQAFLDGLTPRIDALLSATSQSNWAEVGRLSYVIHRCCDVYGYDELATKAASVCEATASREDATVIRREVMSLVGKYARTSSRNTTADVDQDVSSESV